MIYYHGQNWLSNYLFTDSVVVRVPPPDTAGDNRLDEPLTIEMEYDAPEASIEDVRSLQCMYSTSMVLLSFKTFYLKYDFGVWACVSEG